MIRQTDIAILCPILPGRIEELREHLEQLRQQLDSGDEIIFDRLPENHFSRWVILEAAEGIDGDQFEAKLLFSSNVDGYAEDYFYGLLMADFDLIQRLYRCCDSFPDIKEPSHAAYRTIVAYWEHHRMPSGAYHVGSTGLSRARIKREQALVETLQTVIDDLQRSGKLQQASAVEIRQHLQQFVRATPELWWALQAESSATWQETALYISRGIAVVAVVLGTLWLFWLPLMFIALIWLCLLRYHETRDGEADIEDWRNHHEHIARISVEEDHVLQNPMTSITEIKPGLFRQLTLRGVFSVINFAAEYFFTRGRLGDINSIHFARWIIIDRGQRLLFLSNYDGSWERYLGDFVDRAANGLTAVWSNTRGFPLTQWLIKKGARNEQKFKDYARASQLPTQVWYTAYRKLSVANVLNNAAIREGLRGVMSDEDIAKWLNRF